MAALLDHGADANAPLKTWTPTRRSSDDFNFDPALVGATPFWLAAKFVEPNIMRMLAKHGADAKFVHHASWVAEQGFGQRERTETTTTLLAATGAGTGKPWVDAPRAEKEALTLEAVKLAVELGVDVNTPSSDGRTALDGATTLRYPSVVAFLTEKGAKAGNGPCGGGGRGGGRAPAAAVAALAAEDSRGSNESGSAPFRALGDAAACISPPQPFHGLISTHDECDEGIALRQEFPGKRWDEVGTEFLITIQGSLCLLEPLALKAFLPACCFGQWKASTTKASSRNLTMYFLCPGSEDEGWGRNRDRQWGRSMTCLSARETTSATTIGALMLSKA